MSGSYGRAPVPIIAHEMGQMPVYPCWDEIAKYTGTLRARNLEGFRQQANRNGIEPQSRQLQLASGASNRIIYKNEMEAELRSPSCSGVSWLSMQDYSGQGEALCGWLDSFYDSKGLLTPAQFRRYCSATVPLVRFQKYVWTRGEHFQATARWRTGESANSKKSGPCGGFATHGRRHRRRPVPPPISPSDRHHARPDST